MKNLNNVLGYMVEKNEKNKKVFEDMKNEKENYKAFKIFVSWIIFALYGMSITIMMNNFNSGLLYFLGVSLIWYFTNSFVNYVYNVKFNDKFNDIRLVNESLKVRMDLSTGKAYIRDKNNLIFKNALYLANQGTYQNTIKEVIIIKDN